MLPGRIDNPPPAVLFVTIQSTAFARSFEHLVMFSEPVPGIVANRTGWGINGRNVGFYDAIAESINHGVDSDSEHVLMILGVDTGCDSGTKGIRLAFRLNVSL